MNVVPLPLPVYWDDELNNESDEEQDLELTDEVETGHEDALAYLIETRKETTQAFSNSNIKYQRGPEPSRSTKKKRAKRKRGLEKAENDW
jgi:hypothetical protein